MAFWRAGDSHKRKVEHQTLVLPAEGMREYKDMLVVLCSNFQTSISLLEV